MRLFLSFDGLPLKIRLEFTMLSFGGQIPSNATVCQSADPALPRDGAFCFIFSADGDQQQLSRLGLLLELIRGADGRHGGAGFLGKLPETFLPRPAQDQ